MSIPPVNPVRPAALTQPTERGEPSPAESRPEVSAREAASAREAVSESDQLQELRELAEAGQMELKVLELPDTNVVLFRLLELETGRVVREFPSEELTRRLAELRARRLDARV